MPSNLSQKQQACFVLARSVQPMCAIRATGAQISVEHGIATHTHAGAPCFADALTSYAGAMTRRPTPAAYPSVIVSPDGNVYLHWEFYRNP